MKTIFTIVVVLIIIRAINRLIFNLSDKNRTTSQSQSRSSRFRSYTNFGRTQNQQTSKKKVGEVFIDKEPPKSPKDSKEFKGGEYVDFEEIK